MTDRDFCEKILATMEKKQADYTAGGDRFANFDASKIFGVDPKLGLLIRAQDKMMRLNSYIQNGALLVEGEGFEDAIEDVIGYMLILRAWLSKDSGLRNDMVIYPPVLT